MSKSLASYEKTEREHVIRRRLANGAPEEAIRGNGYWAAVDAAQKLGINVSRAKTKQERKDNLSQIEREERRDRKHITKRPVRVGRKLGDVARFSYA